MPDFAPLLKPEFLVANAITVLLPILAYLFRRKKSLSYFILWDDLDDSIIEHNKNNNEKRTRLIIENDSSTTIETSDYQTPIHIQGVGETNIISAAVINAKPLIRNRLNLVRDENKILIPGPLFNPDDFITLEIRYTGSRNFLIASHINGVAKIRQRESTIRYKIIWLILISSILIQIVILIFRIHHFAIGLFLGTILLQIAMTLSRKINLFEKGKINPSYLFSWGYMIAVFAALLFTAQDLKYWQTLTISLVSALSFNVVNLLFALIEGKQAGKYIFREWAMK